jgi:hypothetical protein
MGIVGDLSLKDDKAVLADGESFLKTYPKSNMFEAVKAQMNGVIAMSRIPKTPAPPPAAAAEPAPCMKASPATP